MSHSLKEHPSSMNRLKQGFTLVELMIAIIIIGIMATVVLVGLNVPETLAKTRDGARINTLKQYHNIIQAYYADRTIFPKDPGCISVTVGGVTVCGDSTISHDWIAVLVEAGYTKNRDVKDPKNGQTGRNKDGRRIRYHYMYVITPDQRRYKLYTYLEAISSRDEMANDGGVCDNTYEIGSDMTLPIFNMDPWMSCEGV
jgi:prepilin-type N-terminal cleavage/methylation domain-containing protein